MIDFKILKKSKKSKARLGILKTKNGVIRTPCLIPVATQGCIKTLGFEEVKKTKTQGLICNTFHLHLKPGEDIVDYNGGLHKFTGWDGPLMTDSGGFQVFSLGFGKDNNIGKVSFCNRKFKKEEQPKSLKITEKGVYFKSPLDGKELFLNSKKSIRIQEKLGADIIFSFDECPPPSASKEYMKNSLRKTHNWARECIKFHKKDQALYGIVQGGKYGDLRKESARFIGSLSFDGFGIGGEFGAEKKDMKKMLNIVVGNLPFQKPRHLLGIGHLEDIELIVKEGMDTFDCTVPTHYGRRGIVFTSGGRLDLRKSKFLKDKKPLDKNCSCFVCGNYKRSYISHLIRAREITPLKLLTFHNLYFFNSFIERTREKIKNDEI